MLIRIINGFSCILLVLLGFLAIGGVTSFSQQCSIDIDVRGFVEDVYSDGILRIDTISVSDTNLVGKIPASFYLSLAGVKIPSIDTAEGREAIDALGDLVKFAPVIIDLDEESFFVEDRFVGIVFVPLNNTHVINVNKWLVVNGYAVPSDGVIGLSNTESWSLVCSIVNSASNVHGEQQAITEGEGLSFAIKLLISFIVILLFIIVISMI